MSTLKVESIQHPESSAPAITLDSNGSMIGGFPSPNRNLLYNGAMQVAQRGTSATGLTGTGVVVTADRWVTQISNAGTWTQTVENDAPTGSGFRKSLKVLCTTANASLSSTSQIQISQRLEGQDLQRIAKGTASAKSLTMSFWVKSNLTGTYIAMLYDRDNGRSISQQYSISTSATWEKKTLVFSADTVGAFDNDNSDSIHVYFALAEGSNFTSGSLGTTWDTYTDARSFPGQTNLASATNNYWQITGVQLETGPVATSFEFKTYGQELRECQRYWQQSYESGVAAGTINAGAYIANRADAGGECWVVYRYKVDMRIPPVNTVYSYATGASGKSRDHSAGVDRTCYVEAVGTGGCSILTVGTSSANQIRLHITSNAEL